MGTCCTNVNISTDDTIVSTSSGTTQSAPTEQHYIDLKIQNLETYSLVWCSTNIIGKHIQSQLRTVINYLKIFDNIDDCQCYIQDNEDNKIVLIVSNNFAPELLSFVHDLQQVSTVYLEGTENETLLKQYSKIKSIIITDKNCVEQISIDHKKRHQFQNTETFQIQPFDKNNSSMTATILWFRLLIEHVVRLTEGPSLTELIDVCRVQYADNPFELAHVDEFSYTYNPSKALWWYTRDSFIYRLLNQALWTQNIELIVMFREFISHLINQLAEKQSFDEDTITVYRGQMLAMEEISVLKMANSPYVIMKSFLSTSKNRQIALSFVQDCTMVETLQRVLFTIEANTQLKSNPFADVSGASEFQDEEEILFSLTCIFKVTHVTYSNEDKLWHVKMVLCSDNEYELKSVSDLMKNQINTNIDLVSFVDFLEDAGYSTLLNDDHIAKKYRELAIVYSKSKTDLASLYALGKSTLYASNRDEALSFFEQALELALTSSTVDYSTVISIYTHIAQCHTNYNYELAKSYIAKVENLAVSLLKDYPLLAAEGFLNISEFCYHDDDDVAISYLMKCLDIQREHLDENDLRMAVTESKLGLRYIRMVNNGTGNSLMLEDAMQHYFKCLKIQLASLPPNHPELIKVYHDIGYVYELQNERELALDNYTKALDICKKSLNSNCRMFYHVRNKIQYFNQ